MDVLTLIVGIFLIWYFVGGGRQKWKARKSGPGPGSGQLMQCPACQKDVSPAAVNCPGCGHPLKQVESRDAFAVKLIVAIILVVVAWNLWSHMF